MNVNRYLPFAFIYFFINSLGLPFGLTYTSLLAPLFYAWIIIIRKKEVLLPFIAILLPFIAVHVLLNEIVLDAYLVSLLNLLLVYVFCQTVYTFLIVCGDIEKIFRWILGFNFILCLIAIPFYFTPYYPIFWDEQIITEGVGRLRRLRLFTYEPSYYAFIFTPVFIFFLLQYLFRQNRIRGVLLLPMLFLPYLLSFSIGVMGALVVALLVTWVIFFRRLTSKKRIANAIFTTSVSLAVVLFTLLMFLRNNPVFTRFRNIITGRDSSGRGRTSEAFILAGKLISQSSEFWGIGLGQIKIAGESIIKDFYLYNMDIVVTIPNAAAETLAIFGWVGLSLRILVEIFFFFYTRVWSNYYRLSLFLFVFIYQFTGSFITNAAEYIAWILAFTNVFPQFDVRKRQDGDMVSPSNELQQV